MKKFTSESMLTIVKWLQNELKEIDVHGIVEFEVLNPDIADSKYAGEKVTANSQEFVYRGYKAWSDLAELSFCKMLTPVAVSQNTVKISFKKLDLSESFHNTEVESKEEKYGVDSDFFLIDKTEEPAFLSPYLKALESVKIKERKRVLNLGINGGNEFEVIKQMLDDEEYENIKLIGIDHSSSAIEYAKKRFSESNVSFFCHDINSLDEIRLGRFDLIVSIGTLQSPGIAFKQFFMSLIQNSLKKGGAVILGFPNCRWLDGEMIYGAKAPNYSYSEMSLLYKDVYFCKKYLQQHKFRVTLTGKDYVFLTATSIG